MNELNEHAMRVFPISDEVQRGDIGRWIRLQPGHTNYRLTPGSKLFVVMKNRQPVATFELTPFPLVQCVFDPAGSVFQSVRAFEAIRVGMDTMGISPYIAVADDSPLLSQSERLMVPALPRVKLFKFG